MFGYLKSLMPRGLYGRAILILVVPVVTIQLVVSIAFIQRHFERVTEQMTTGVALEVRLLRDQIAAAPDLPTAQRRSADLAKALDLQISFPERQAAQADLRDYWDLSGRAVIMTLRSSFPEMLGADLTGRPRTVRLGFESPHGPLQVVIDRSRVSASNPHQLLVLMIVTSLLMTLIAIAFMRNQLRPIKQLGEAATAFGKGQHLPYRARGATEVRAAGSAFLDMRARIERQIEQRTLLLSGISHDLRSPLTRLKLGLSMLPEDDEAEALLGDVSDMERLVDEFLSFVRGDAMESAEPTDPYELAQRAVTNAQRMGHAVALAQGTKGQPVHLRPAAVTRALENLIGNAVRYGTRAEVSVLYNDRSVRLVVEDNGPGIPKELRDEALRPFTRLDGARDPNKGGGVGLGLSIAVDIARSHGGSLRLGQSETLGGLRAELVLAR